MPLSISVLASGSSGNATYVASDQTRLLLDCGLPARETVARLDGLGVDPRTIDGILLTHAHGDHCNSAGTMHRKYGIPVFTHPLTDQRLRLKPSNGSYGRVKVAFPFPDRIGDLGVRTFRTAHGGPNREAGGPVGFVISRGRTSFGYATDVGSGTKHLAEALQGVDGLLLETNFDEEIVLAKMADEEYRADWSYLGWVFSPRGHLSNQRAGRALVRLATERTTDVFMGHISRNHPDGERDNNSFEHAEHALREAIGAAGRRDIRIHRTSRRGPEAGGPTPLLTLG